MIRAGAEASPTARLAMGHGKPLCACVRPLMTLDTTEAMQRIHLAEATMEEKVRSEACLPPLGQQPRPAPLTAVDAANFDHALKQQQESAEGRREVLEGDGDGGQRT